MLQTIKLDCFNPVSVAVDQYKEENCVYIITKYFNMILNQLNVENE